MILNSLTETTWRKLLEEKETKISIIGMWDNLIVMLRGLLLMYRQKEW